MIAACGRTFAHREHEVTRDGADFRCYGLRSTSLADLLHRRPELGDLTAVTIVNRLGVSAA